MVWHNPGFYMTNSLIQKRFYTANKLSQEIQSWGDKPLTELDNQVDNVVRKIYGINDRPLDASPYVGWQGEESSLKEQRGRAANSLQTRIEGWRDIPAPQSDQLVSDLYRQVFKVTGQAYDFVPENLEPITKDKILPFFGAFTFPEHQLRSPNYPGHNSSILGRFVATGGFMEDHGHSQKSPKKAIFLKTPNQIRNLPSSDRNIGVDLVFLGNKNIRAWLPGTVTKVGIEPGYGNRIHIACEFQFEFNGGKYPVMMAYGHLADINCVQGQKIKQGDLIGVEGGTSGGSHTYPTHLDLRSWVIINGEMIDVSPNLIDNQIESKCKAGEFLPLQVIPKKQGEICLPPVNNRLFNGTQFTAAKITNQDFESLAHQFGIKVAAAKAVIEIESSGGGFFSSGRPKILFEGHHFYRLTPKPVSRTHPNISYPKWDRNKYYGGEREYERLYQAIAFDPPAALQSASWGLGQIMGFNYQMVGYSDIYEFVHDMHLSEYHQAKAMFQFINKANLLDEINRQDWAGFARGYNGPGYKANQYDVKLAQAYQKFA